MNFLLSLWHNSPRENDRERKVSSLLSSSSWSLHPSKWERRETERRQDVYYRGMRWKLSLLLPSPSEADSKRVVFPISLAEDVWGIWVTLKRQTDRLPLGLMSVSDVMCVSLPPPPWKCHYMPEKIPCRRRGRRASIVTKGRGKTFWGKKVVEEEFSIHPFCSLAFC